MNEPSPPHVCLAVSCVPWASPPLPGMHAPARPWHSPGPAKRGGGPTDGICLADPALREMPPRHERASARRSSLCDTLRPRTGTGPVAAPTDRGRPPSVRINARKTRPHPPAETSLVSQNRDGLLLGNGPLRERRQHGHYGYLLAGLPVRGRLHGRGRSWPRGACGQADELPLVIPRAPIPDPDGFPPAAARDAHDERALNSRTLTKKG